MSELSFEQMFEESSFKRLRTGEAVTGQVIGVKEANPKASSQEAN